MPLGAAILVARFRQSPKGKREGAIKITGKGRPTEFHRGRWNHVGSALEPCFVWQEIGEVRLKQFP